MVGIIFNTVTVVITPVIVLTVVTIGDADCFTPGLGTPIIESSKRETERMIATKSLSLIDRDASTTPAKRSLVGSPPLAELTARY